MLNNDDVNDINEVLNIYDRQVKIHSQEQFVDDENEDFLSGI
jgi:hypothetical protein